MDLYKVNSNNDFIKQENLLQAFSINLNVRQTIAFVGAGGKTSTIYILAEELVAAGKRVIVTTTTHMEKPQEYGVLEENQEKILQMLEDYSMAVVGTISSEGKMSGVSDKFFEWMTTTADFVLVEADGSKRLPLKVPNATEPVIPKSTNLVIVVAGLSALYKSIEETCHRKSLVAEILNRSLMHKIEPNDVARLLKTGYCERLGLPCKILLNQYDRVDHKEDVLNITANLIGYDCIIKGGFVPQ